MSSASRCTDCSAEVNELRNRNEMLNVVAQAALTLWRNTDRFTKDGDPNWEELMEALSEADLLTCADFA